jgi:phospholipase D1/2
MSTPPIRSDRAAVSRSADAAAPGILRPGANCWRLAHADRVGFVVDGAAFFSAVAEAFERARKRIVILGWDIDARIRLRDDHPGETLGSLLAACTLANPELHAWVLGWDFAPIYFLERDPLLRVRFALGTPARVHFELDGRVPAGGSQHEKLIIVDDALAFCGGLDLCDVRWDTPEHAAADPRRIDVHGEGYRPHHDVQIAVDGNAAAAIGELARMRWERATGHAMPELESTPSPWPECLPVDIRDVEVGIVRTRPVMPDGAEVREVEQLWTDSIAAAEHSVYIENPYFTARAAADAIVRRLRAGDDVEIVVVTPQESSGWMEDITMGVLRDQMIGSTRTASPADRFHVLAPWLPPPQPGAPPVSLNLHSKVCIVDDRLLRIGSANLTNRSMGLDGECDLVIEAIDRPDVAAAITGLRDRLLAEHLGTTPERVAAAVDSHGRLGAAITSLADGERTLRPYQPMPSPLADELLPDPELIDPSRPLEGRQIGRWLAQPGPDGGKPRRWRYAGMAWWGAFLSAILIGRLTGWIDPADLVRLIEAVQGAPVLSAVGVLLTFVLGGLMFVPVTIMIASCGALFGPWLGLAYALGGAFGGAAVYHVIGRHAGRPLIDTLAGPRLRARLRDVAKRGLLAVAVLRLLPIAPHVVVGLAAGAARVSFRDYMLGTMMVMTPGAVALVMLGHHATGGVATLWSTVSIVAGLLGLVVLGVVLGKRWMAAKPAPIAAAEHPHAG